MTCSNCGGVALKTLSQNILTGGVYEEWKCTVCGLISVQTIPAAAPAVTWTFATATTTLDPTQVQTRQDKINGYWDERKKDIEKLEELDKWMLYYYLNKQGLSIIGLDYKIEAALHKKFPPDPKP